MRDSRPLATAGAWRNSLVTDDELLAQQSALQREAERRLAVLRIKSQWASRPEYGRTVRSFDIYTAVLKDGVRDVDGFASWLSP
jgi:hypothetical protein